MKPVFCFLVFLSILVGVSAYSQPEPTLSTSEQNSEPTFTPDGVWHKNMELICPVPLPNQPWGEHSQAVTINNKKFFLSTHGTSGLRLTDVTNPRSTSVALTITAKYKHDLVGTDGNIVLQPFDVEFKTNEVWTEDPEGTGTLNGHTFAVFEVGGDGNKFITVKRDPANGTPSDSARILIIDLTEALALIANPGGGGTTSIHIDDVVDRNSAHRVGVTENSHKIHIGYISTDDTKVNNDAVRTVDNIHTLHVEKNIGILAISPLQKKTVPTTLVSGGTAGFIDLFDLSNLIGHDNANSTTTLMEPIRLLSNGLPILVQTTASVIDSKPAEIHETDIHRTRVLDNGHPTGTFETKRIDLALASFGRSTKHLQHSDASQTPGGAIILEVNYNNTPVNNTVACTVTHLQTWKYDDDRQSPASKTSSNSNWSWRACHTVEGMHFDHHNHLYLTTEELGTPKFTPDITLEERSSSNGTFYTNFTQPVHFESPTASNDASEDHRRLGNYLRIWSSTKDHRTFEGVGDDDAEQQLGGPCGSYEIPEQSPTDRSANQFNPVLGTNGITSVDCSKEENERAPNTIHHVRTMYGTLGVLPVLEEDDEDELSLRTEAYVAAYSQGVRVIDLRNFIVPNEGFNHTNGPNPIEQVIEKAYFDFIPTLNYDQDSRYFYANASGGNNYYNGVIPITNYFTGPIDAYPDMPINGRPTGIELDENFLYTYGFVGKQGPWLQNGGFMILRYFRDKIGGTITGYDGTGAQGDMDFREVNLQGIFEVSRDVTVASGATVNLLKDTKLNPDASPGECLIIDGTVNVQTLAAEFTSTTGRGVIDVPVLVRNGGKLVVNEGAVIDFLKPVTVNLGGELRIKAGAKVVFGSDANTCNGKFFVEGTSTSRAKIKAKLSSTDRNVIIGNGYIKMKGTGPIFIFGIPYPSALSHLKVHYADVQNICIEAIDIPAANPMLLQSTFKITVTAAKPYLMSFDNSSLHPLYNFFNPLSINVCTFKDNDVALPYLVHGLNIRNTYFARVENSTFENLATSAYIDGGIFINLKDNLFDNCYTGVEAMTSLPLLCGNDFDDAEFGYKGLSTLATFLFDNTFVDNQKGSMNLLGNTHFFRGNVFNEYCTGVVGLGGGSLLQLTDRLDPNSGTWYKYGRNSFTVSASAIGPWGCFTDDINLAGSMLAIKCGYNDLSANSTNHVLGNPNLTLDVHFNKWNPGTAYIVRTNMGTAGVPRDQSQMTTAVCGTVEVTEPCPSNSICSGDVLPGIYLTSDVVNINDSLWTMKFDSVWGWQASPTASLWCRLHYLQGAFTLAGLRDSTAIYETARDSFDAVYLKTSDSAAVRSRALLLKGFILERMDSIPAALSAYSTVVGYFQTSADSIPAAWRIQYLNAMLDTTLRKDTLLQAYHTRVLNDSRRMTHHQYVAPKIAAPTVSGRSSRVEGLVLEQNIPNPWSSKTEIAFTLPNAGTVRLTVMDILGNEVAVLVDGEQKAGRNSVSYKAADVPNGIYFYRLQYGNEVITQKMQKSN